MFYLFEKFLKLRRSRQYIKITFPNTHTKKALLSNDNALHNHQLKFSENLRPLRPLYLEKARYL
ncbi:hypothetical protein HanIR_Chr11g0544891 [Helianthus annuus]|nr:hypothetical protein HanIR_Chr11g0544891 [Helianthus annuus]